MKKPYRFSIMIIISIFTIIATAILSAVVTFEMMSLKIEGMQNRYEAYSKISEIDEIVNKYYLRPIEQEKKLDAMLKGYINGIGDQFGAYFSKAEYQKYSQNRSGRFTGIGLRVQPDSYNTSIIILSVDVNSPAEKAGVKAGDIIIKVGNDYISDIGYYQAVSNMQGEVDTTISFTVVRDLPQVEKVFNVQLKDFLRETVISETLDGNIGYVKITSFDESTFSAFEKVVNKFVTDNVNSIIFDVRHNTGGDANVVCNVLDKLVGEGALLKIVDKNGVETITNKSDANQVNLPMAVLIDAQTYSAAELFAATIRDYEKGKLVGENTYGKGVGQKTFELRDRSALHITTFFYAPGKSESYEGKGVAPDIEIKMTKEQIQKFYLLKHDEDSQLQAAISSLKEPQK